MARIRISGLIGLNRALGPDLIARPINDFLRAGTALLERESDRGIPSDTGALRRSRRREVQPVQPGHVPGFGEVRFTAPHAKAVQSGTPPHFPPPTELAGWASRRGLDPFVVARGIARRGTRRRPFLRSAVRRSRPPVRQLLEQMGDSIARRWQQLGRSSR